MRIAMVSEHASPLVAAGGPAAGGMAAGGQNVHVEALSRALARSGHEVTVYTRRDDRRVPARVPIDDGVVVEHLAAGPPKPIAEDDSLLPYVGELGAELAARFAAQPPDLVHAHFWTSGLAALLGTQEAGIPVVQTFHTLGGTERPHQHGRDSSPPARIRLEQALARDVAHIIATSTAEADELVSFGARRQAVSVLPCGVDVDLFTPAGPVAPRTARHRLVSVGRLVPHKGFETVLRALAVLPDTELLIAGGRPAGRLAVDPEARRLRQLATRLGVANRVRLLGAVPRAELPALLRSADAVVCAPWYEPFGIVPLEAMACGVPVVATAVGGQVDTVVDGATGVLVPPKRPDLLAGAIRQLLTEPFWRDAYGTGGADRARSRYSWGRIAADTAVVYQQVLGIPTEPALTAQSDLDDLDDLEVAGERAAPADPVDPAGVPAAVPLAAVR
jgi:D-inositol-3-phosphate glycosyltransferase